MPSRSMSVVSMPRWSSASSSRTASRISPLTFPTAVLDALAAEASHFRRAARPPRARLSTPLRARWLVHAHRSRARPRPRRWGCRANPRPRGRPRARSHSCDCLASVRLRPYLLVLLMLLLLPVRIRQVQRLARSHRTSSSARVMVDRSRPSALACASTCSKRVRNFALAPGGRSSCATAATATAARACATAVGNVERRDRRRASSGSRRSTSAASTRRSSSSTAPTTRPGSAPTRSSACRWRWPRPRPTSSALPLYRYVGGAERARAAGADDERAQRRRARRQQRRPAGVHDRAGRRGELHRGAALGRRDVPRAEDGCCTSGACRPRVGDEGGFAPDLPTNEEALQLLVEAIERGRLHARRGDRDRARPGGDRVLPRRRVRARRARGAALGRPSSPTTWADLVRPLPDRLDRGRHGRGRLGRLGRAHRRGSATACSSSATTCSSPTPSGCERGIELGVANSILDQGQPDRHAHRDARQRWRWRRAPATRR